MIVNRYTILAPDECTRCAACGAPLSVGDTVSELDGKSFCGGECVKEHVGKMMARLHGGREQRAEESR